MSQSKLIATLLRSIADLIDAHADGGGIPAATVRIGSRIHVENIPARVRPQSESNNQSLPQKEDEDVEKPTCKTCLNGGKGRHRADCPRSNGRVVDHSQEPETEDDAVLEDQEGYEEAKERVDEINASEVKHKCCGSKGWRHKAGCDHGGSSFPEKVGSKFGIDQDELEESEKQPDLKTFECEACGKRFQAEPDYVKCDCGSNMICWPIE